MDSYLEIVGNFNTKFTVLGTFYRTPEISVALMDEWEEKKKKLHKLPVKKML